MIRRLRNVSMEKLLDPDMLFHTSNRDFRKHLYAVLSPYKTRTQRGLNKYYFLYDHIYLALIVSVAAGLVGFSSGSLDISFGAINDVLGSRALNICTLIS